MNKIISTQGGSVSGMKKGVYLVLATALISGLANFFNKFGLDALGKNAYQYTTLKNIIPAVVLSIFILTPFIWPKLKSLSRNQWLKLLLIGLIGGSIPFLLFFKGLSLTSAISASFIHKTLFVWVAILALPVLKEKLTKLQLLAVFILLGGNFVFGGFKSFVWGYAHTLVLIATILWAIENVIAKIALKDMDSMIVAWGRMFFGSLILIGFLAWTNNTSGLLAVNFSQFLWLALVGLLLTGYVITWYGAMKKLPVTVVSSFLVLASPITAMLNSLFITHKFPNKDVLGLLTVIVALIIIWQFKPKERYELNTQSA